MHNIRINFIILTLLILLLSGCTSRLFTVYKIDVQQGNAVEPEQVEQLKIGMNKEQVRFLLGTPLINDSFHPNRWDYVYHLIPGYGETIQRHLAVFFEGDIVSAIDKDNIPEPPPEALAEEQDVHEKLITNEESELKE